MTCDMGDYTSTPINVSYLYADGEWVCFDCHSDRRESHKIRWPDILGHDRHKSKVEEAWRSSSLSGLQHSVTVISILPYSLTPL